MGLSFFLLLLYQLPRTRKNVMYIYRNIVFFLTFLKKGRKSFGFSIQYKRAEVVQILHPNFEGNIDAQINETQLYISMIKLYSIQLLILINQFTTVYRKNFSPHPLSNLQSSNSKHDWLKNPWHHNLNKKQIFNMVNIK